MEMIADVFEDSFGRWHPEARFETLVWILENLENTCIMLQTC